MGHEDDYELDGLYSEEGKGGEGATMASDRQVVGLVEGAALADMVGYCIQEEFGLPIELVDCGPDRWQVLVECDDDLANQLAGVIVGMAWMYRQEQEESAE